MTRVNVGVDPSELPDKLLLAEHREIKRIPNAARRTLPVNLPKTFRLGTGHVRFFYNKLGYLKRRYERLYNECIRRGFNVQNYGEAWEGLPLGDYEEQPRDRQLIVERIESKGFQLKENG